MTSVCSVVLTSLPSPVQVYKALRHGITEVAVKMVSCVVRLRSQAVFGNTRVTPFILTRS